RMEGLRPTECESTGVRRASRARGVGCPLDRGRCSAGSASEDSGGCVPAITSAAIEAEARSLVSASTAYLERATWKPHESALALPDVGGWLGMETAPKDGTRIVVLRDGEQYVAQWVRQWEYWGVSVRRPRGFTDGDWEPFHDIGGSTHAITYSLPSPSH